MKVTSKKILILSLAVAAVLGCFTISALDDLDTPIVEPAAGTAKYLDKSLAIYSPLYFVNGRLYFPFLETAEKLGASVEEDGDGFCVNFQGGSFVFTPDSLNNKAYWEDETLYVSVFDLTDLFSLSARFDSSNNIVNFYRKSVMPQTSEGKAEGRQRAYLRLEDVSSDNGATGNLTNERMEKMRAMADYLESRGQAFYIAWIPKYVYPENQMENDLTKNFNFFNADFLYTLDYMTHPGGNIVLHGYTHQERDTMSAIGTEFGPDSPFSVREAEERMIKAKETAAFFGFENNKFEFPHYVCTGTQLKLAEKHFDVIYQPNTMISGASGKITRVSHWGNSTLYVPTPIGYITKDTFQDTLGKMDNLPDDQITSLFFHPYLDYDNIMIQTVNGVRTATFSPNSYLVQLVDKVTSQNKAFSTIDLDAKYE